MSGDYISREAAIEWATRDLFDGQTADYVAADIKEKLNAVPAADVVEVVRCRDCKYRAEDDFCTGRGWPDQLVADDGFCEKGKRK